MKLFLPVLLLYCLAFNTQAQWTSKNASSTTQRHHGVTFTVGGDVYLVSGTTAASNPLGTDNFYRYIPENDSWVELDKFPGGARSYAYAGVYNDKAYFGFGSNDNITFFNDLWEFNPATGEWKQLSSCPCEGRTHPAFVVQQGKVFVGLGGGRFNDLNDWWEYEIGTDTWTQRPSLPGPPRHHPFHFAAGDQVYAGCGHQGFNFYDDWYKYDPSTNAWTQMKNHPGGPRVAGQEFSHNGYGYVISGDGNNHFNLEEGEFWKYNHEDDTWTRLPDHPRGNSPDGRGGRWAPGSFVLDDHIYFFGGVNRGGGVLFGDMYSYQLEMTVHNQEQVTIPISAFPNPASQTIFLSEEIPDNTALHITIFNSLGKIAKTDKLFNRKVYIGDLTDGHYFMNIVSSENKIFTTKFIVLN